MIPGTTTAGSKFYGLLFFVSNAGVPAKKLVSSRNGRKTVGRLHDGATGNEQKRL
jgi:hypothetical protein